MKKINKALFALYLCLSFGACTTVNKKIELRAVGIQELEKINLGASADQVLQILGEPTEKEETRGGIQRYTVWNYKIKGDIQRASLTMDLTSKKVVDKLIVPLESEPESSLDHLLKNKFSKNVFQELAFPRCKRDFTSDEAMMVDIRHGIWIRYRRTTKYVVGIGWGPPEKSKHDIEMIRNCQTY